MEYKKNAKDDSMTFLAAKSRTVDEVKKHLQQKGYEREAIEEALEFLQDCQLIDDEAYCDDFIQKEMDKGRGPKRISQTLAEKGIEGSLAQLKLEEWFDRQTEKKLALAAAKKLWERRGAALDEEDPAEPASFDEAQERRKARDKELARIARKLEYQGFRSGVIFDVLAHLR